MAKHAMLVQSNARELGELSLATAFHWAVSRYPSQAPRILLLLLGWASVWLIVEFLVVNISSRPGRPIWSVLHLSYFWGTAYWEAAILRSALGAFEKAPQSWRSKLLDHRLALRFLVLKMLLLPAILIGTALLVAPGLYCMARFGPALFFVAQGQTGPKTALRLSNQVTQGRRGHLMFISLFLLLFNMLGAALLGLGLIVTVPMSILICAHVCRDKQLINRQGTNYPLQPRSGKDGART